MPNLTPETRTNLQTVLNFIEAHPDNFDMMEWGAPDYLAHLIDLHEGVIEHACGTAACIGGTAQALLFPRGKNPTWVAVGSALGLDMHESNELFFCRYSVTGDRRVNISDIKQRDAVRHLKAILNGKKPDWRACNGQTLAWREAY